MENNSKYMSLVIVLSLILIGLGIYAFASYAKVKEIKNEINQLEAKKDDRESYNKQIEKKQIETDKEVGNADVIRAATDFNNKFYNWSSWNEFSDNMDYLKKTYPNLEDSDIVDISGKAVGNGESPESSYTSEIFPTDKKGEISEIVTQEKTQDNSDTQLLWYKVSKYNKGKYDISYFKPYEEVDFSNDSE
ncbi:hypothetical protein [Staphylococcus caprae]|uniref:hypothetical protein n=1 Tax=Staphylococcus caprae TaxID=29380 RepID=UPI00145184BC|nr:hypothetical protein [Staphylococcus caprae]QJE26684.1 hypothetical protein HHJ99_13010 [Staphylococcus caprae]